MNAQQILLKSLESGSIEQTLEGLRHVFNNNNGNKTFPEIIFQLSRYREAVKSRRKNLISQADYQIELDRIRQAALELIMEMPEYWQDESLNQIVFPREKNNFILGLTMLSLIMLIIFIIWSLLLKSPKEQLSLPALSIDKTNDTTLYTKKKNTEQNDTSLTVPAKETTGNNKSDKLSKNRLKLSGWVKDKETMETLSGVVVQLLGKTIYTNNAGYFIYEDLDNGIQPGTDILVSFEFKGYSPWVEYMFIPGSNGKTIFLSKKIE